MIIIHRGVNSCRPWYTHKYLEFCPLKVQQMRTISNTVEITIAHEELFALKKS